MDVDTRESGWKITWKVQAFTFGMTEECIRVNTKTIKSTGMASTLGQMVAVTKGIGSEASNMVWALTWFLKMER